ncbi:hypothetical protein GCM10010390_47280 [Streptomyces mordarskii]|uniref:Integrase n=1 Tax=Streptomyces mordarskii TaxID=1226758 RepID=A0ABP3NAG9_9ACTN
MLGCPTEGVETAREQGHIVRVVLVGEGEGPFPHRLLCKGRKTTQGPEDDLPQVARHGPQNGRQGGQGPVPSLGWATGTERVMRRVLAFRPYDLRHAGVSQWLNSGVMAPEVAARVGHSVDVLLKIYAKCIDGQEDEMNDRILKGLGEEDV